MSTLPKSDNDAANSSVAASAPPPVAPRPAVPLALRALWTIVIVAILAGIYAWHDQGQVTRTLRGEVAHRLTAADAASAQARERDSDLANQLREAQAKLALLDARVAEFQSQQSALEALYRDLAPSRDELALSEVEQILVLASQQLSLAGNVHAALAGLQVADAKLAQLDRPQLAPVRRALARDIERLKAVPYVDVAGISIRLDQLIDAIDALPLAKDERVAPHAASTSPMKDPAWMRFLDGLWSDLKSVIRIQVDEHPTAPLIAPEQSFFLRENLRLRLLSARLALLARDDRSFKADLTAARDWLSEYFDAKNRQVQATLATLSQLSSIAMPTEMPDLSASLDAVRALEAATDRAPASGR
ncbi:MAG TPA: uroporphyrinogen-III C-methyltransferase [Casimicrobiaceae bacterium]|nr:uroporphyrinogen-III C-methyltransferase [Casimicrobiaceae bacterium]